MALVVPFYKIWQMSVSQSAASSSRVYTIGVEKGLPDGIYFHDRVILIVENGDFRLLSSKCTHLGCKINKSEDGVLVCPCHGSRYNESGFPVKGPAVNPLAEIPFTIMEDGNGLMLQYKI